MTDPGTNTTFTTASNDYSDYYDHTSYIPTCDEEELKAFGMVFVPTLYSFVFIVGFLGNGLVVCVLVKHRNQTNLTDICLFNLALSDLLFVFTLPFYAHYSVVSQWNLGGFLCSFISACHHTGFLSSIFFMVVMTLDRYIVIMHAQRLTQHRSPRACVIMSTFVWLLSLFFSLPSFFFTKVLAGVYGPVCLYQPDERAWEFYDVISTNTLGLVLPLLVMVFCYSRIIPTVTNMRSAKKHRAVKLIVSIVVVFFLFWVPYNISIVIYFLHSLDLLQSSCRFEKNLKLSVTATETFAYAHCCLNPIIYAFVGQKFMKRTLHLLRGWVPGIPCTSSRHLSDSSFNKSSVVSRSSDVTSSFVM